MSNPRRVDPQEVCPEERIADVLVRVRRELEDIAERIDRNQSMIARATWSHVGEDSDYVQAMQDADLSAQRIAGLAGFISAIADAAEPGWRVDSSHAGSTLTLAESARTLGSADGAAGYSDSDASGEVDLF